MECYGPGVRRSCSVKEAPLVFAVVLNWNSESHVRACVACLEAQTHRNLKIVIVDNDSPDGSGQRLREAFPGHELIQTGKNLGYGWGNNHGIRLALGRGADFVWIVNPDLRASRETLAALLECMAEKPEAGICGPMILWERKTGPWREGGIRFAPGGWWPEPVMTPGDAPLLKTSEKYTLEDGILGCSMLVRARVFREAGLIREEFFMYHEETEFCLRARDRGWKSFLCQAAQDKHLHKDGRPPAEQYYLVRNQVLLARIRGKFVFRTVLRAAGFLECLKSAGKGKFYEIRRRISAVIRGLGVPVRPVPFPESREQVLRAG